MLNIVEIFNSREAARGVFADFAQRRKVEEIPIIWSQK